ncbi:amidohydrolase [Brevibacterium sp. 5221]|uniref:Amidohydrolase n=1 Tax=Brevibacterium rongguiense TaxID=2695267 RepID=A0A6N9H886_9MICO|nr:amidohydrolase [Brevibacterium rongguiense]MYM20278.1 amidohydrolase [Brevibacterium rongguiense]
MAIAPELTAALDADMPAVVATYKDFHATPELSMQEHETAQKIRARLDELGYETFASGGTGVVGVLRNGDGPTIAYRADTDGLPIAEDTGLPFASQATGTLPDGSEAPVMHGCGHDTHITVGLETAVLLAGHRDTWSGTIVFLFQPGEETGAGAKAMVDDGVWDRAPHPEAVYGQHVWPALAGTVSTSSGTAMAMADSYEVVVRGRQAHGSQPEAAIDPIVLGAFMITRLQTVVSREVGAREMVVLTIGRFNGGLKENIIPAEARFTINTRTFDPAVRAHVEEVIGRIVRAEAQASGAPEPEIRKLYDFPECYNDPELTADFFDVVRAELGAEQAVEVPPATGSEDFGRFGQAVGAPAVYWFFGSQTPQALAAENVPSNHSPHFAPTDIETTLRTGVRAALAVLTSRLRAAR